MLTTFLTLKELYESSEVTMADLETLQAHDFIRFENKGISRSERDCLLCEVHCEPLASFLERVTAAVFETPEALRQWIAKAGLGLSEIESGDAALLSFQSSDKQVEIIASVAEDGEVSIDPDDIELLPFFQVFLRVQH